MKVLQENAQYFEDNSPTMPEHKRENVTGITFNFINVASNGGDNSPASSIGINLPNSNWIRSKHGSKSVNSGNISTAYSKVGGHGFVDEFYLTDVEKKRAKKYGEVADVLETALHEVIGHGSGKLEEGCANATEHALAVFHSTIEEGRADLVALYYMMDPKMIEFGLMDDLEVGRCSYDTYITNALLIQYRRLELGAKIEEAHMKNRHWISAWVYEKGISENVISKVIQDNKTYFVINDYEKLRILFGTLLREVQRIKSQGDLAAAKSLVEKYGVNVDYDRHKEVLERCAKLNISPYKGFLQATYTPVYDSNQELIDVKLDDNQNVCFMDQIVDFCDRYGLLSRDV